MFQKFYGKDDSASKSEEIEKEMPKHTNESERNLN